MDNQSKLSHNHWLPATYQLANQFTPNQFTPNQFILNQLFNNQSKNTSHNQFNMFPNLFNQFNMFLNLFNPFNMFNNQSRSFNNQFKLFNNQSKLSNNQLFKHLNPQAELNTFPMKKPLENMKPSPRKNKFQEKES